MTRKLNEIRRTSKFAWSPGHHILATSTMSGALDESFSSTSELELFKLESGSFSQQASHKVSTTSRFNTLAWGHIGSSHEHGMIAGGMETGDLELWDPSSILNNKNDTECLILRKSTHSGTLAALDFNLFQTNLLASAGSNSEVYIWDLNQPSTPYTPGARSSKMDEISSVAWNCQVQHIVSTSSTNGYTVIWDLRNKKEVMTLAYPVRGPISSIVWHPDIATQIVTASSDDQNPIISLWDLRHAQSPEKTLSGHSKGVLDVSWCRQDSDLLVSSGKDGKTLCWNPNTGKLNGELLTNNKSTHQVDWCPRQPDLLASASFDGSIHILSIQGTSCNKPILDAPGSQFHLKEPPKWLRRPVGATFGFSGKLVTFNNKIAQSAVLEAATSGTTVPNLKTLSRRIKLATIETDLEIIKRSEQLESATENNVDGLIQDRIRAGKDKQDWQVLQTLFSDNARETLMQYLGFERDQVVDAANALLPPPNKKEKEKTTTVSTLFGNTVEPEVGFFGRMEPTSMIEKSHPFSFYTAGTSEPDSLITRALVLGDFESAVNVCLAAERFADALMIAMCGGSDLLTRTQNTYFESQTKKFAYLRLLQGIVEDDLSAIVRDADLKDWASVLVVLCTFAQSENFGPFCEILGDRLSQDEQYKSHATLFYLAAGQLEKVSSIWISQFEQEEKSKDNMTHGVRLQALVEKVTIFRKAIDYEDHAPVSDSGEYILKDLYQKYCEYAEFMASQGQLEVALKYISLTPTDYARISSRGSSVVRDRVFHASGRHKGHQEPRFPFEKKNINEHTDNKNKLQNNYMGAKSPQPSQTATVYQPTAWNDPPASPKVNHRMVAGNKVIRGLNGPPPPPSSSTTIGYYSAHQQPQQFQTRGTPPPPMNAVAPLAMRQTKNK
ncbi:hypothetical protein HPULCUR_002576 [Helicostylum pulchrum]|uniref:Protein transport protein SEC31 n=1 Tax=Helicostylum pulchrum TaxID=562976 RepID=A0ABP9XQW3_9FUNG